MRKYTVKSAARKQTLTATKITVVIKCVQINGSESAASPFCRMIRQGVLCETKKKAAVTTDKAMTHA
jgi:hypothetical protein